MIPRYLRPTYVADGLQTAVRSAVVAMTITLACPVLSLAQSGMQLGDVARLRSVVEAVVSPNGEWVAYTLSVPREPLVDEDGKSWSHLYIVDSDGMSRCFIGGQETIGSIAWSADSRSVYYLAKRGDDEYNSLYRIPVDGGESTKVVSLETAISGFDVSPSGEEIALLAAKPKDEQKEKLRKSGFDQEIYEEDWESTALWLATFEEIAADPKFKPRQVELEGTVIAATWAPEGNRLAVVVAPTPSVDDSYMRKSIAIVSIDDGEVLESVPHAAKLGEVAWGPSGDQIAFIAGQDIHDPQDGRLMVYKLGSGRIQDLLPGLEGHVTSFAWSDRTTIAWTADVGTLTNCGSVSLDGEIVDWVQQDVNCVASHLTLSEDGKTGACIGHSRRHPAEVFLFEAGKAAPRRLTDSNDWLKDRAFARQETVRWKASDGLELQGVLVYPLVYQPGTKYPMIMLVHGGPESHEPDGWMTSYSRPGQVAAARDFFVFYPNYRGSTGRGVAFSKLGQADAAGKEFSDLIDGIDYLVERGLVDIDRVGITGGSYGGYASAWGATYYSDRFAASVMFVGISDNISKVGTTDIPEEMFLVHHRKRLWDDWQYFYERSPIRHVQKNHTPTLILHGKEDPRVHPSQSLELHRHLKTLGQAPVRLVLYEGEGHGNRKAAARFDYSLRLMRWMEYFVKSGATEPPPYGLDYHSELGITSDSE